MLHRSCPILFLKLLFKNGVFHLPFIMNSCPDYLKTLQDLSSAVSPEPEGLFHSMGLFLLSQQAGTLSYAKSIKLSLMSERQWVGRGKAVSFWSCQPWEEQDWWLVSTAKINPGCQVLQNPHDTIWQPCPKGHLRSLMACWVVGRPLQFCSCHTSPVARGLKQVMFCVHLFVFFCGKPAHSQLLFWVGRYPTQSKVEFGRNWQNKWKHPKISYATG